MGWHDHRGFCDKNENDDYTEIPDNCLPDFPVLDVNHTRRVYNSGDYTDNGVRKEHLADHIQYNKTYRPGTALFINGICVNRGYLGKKRCEEIEKLIKGLEIKITPSNLPYQ